MDIGDALAANIRSMRARRRLGQELVAARMRDLGFSEWIRQTVGSTEKPARRVTAAEIIGLAQVLDTTVAALMDISETHFPNGHA